MINKKQIKILVKASFNRGNLDSKKVLRFADKMKRSELREYIKYLKAKIAAKIIYIFVPNLEEIDSLETKKQFSKLFPDKKIIFEEDPDLLLGARIVDNDKVYDFNLKNSFENMTNYISDKI